VDVLCIHRNVARVGTLTAVLMAIEVFGVV
jgi:hypothetical protein